RLIFDLVEHFERVAEGAAEACDRPCDGLVQCVPARLVMTVENLVDHGDHPFVVLGFSLPELAPASRSLLPPTSDRTQSAIGYPSMRSFAARSACSMISSRQASLSASQERARERIDSALATCSTGPSSMNAR